MATMRQHDFVLDGIGEPGGPWERHSNTCWCWHQAEVDAMKKRVARAEANPAPIATEEGR